MRTVGLHLLLLRLQLLFSFMYCSNRWRGTIGVVKNNENNIQREHCRYFVIVLLAMISFVSRHGLRCCCRRVVVVATRIQPAFRPGVIKHMYFMHGGDN